MNIMSNVMSVVETIVPIFLIIAFGYMIQRKGFLNKHGKNKSNVPETKQNLDELLG